MGANEGSSTANPGDLLHLAAYPKTVTKTVCPEREDMHPDELMKPDLLSEVVLLAFGTLTLASLVLFVMITFARS
jgi:hypothetical protein